MNFDFTRIMENLMGMFARMSLAQKVALPIFIIGSIGAIIFVSNWASKPEYGVLFSNLEEADAASVVEYLKDHKIKYDLSGDGNAIRITPKEMIHEVRLELSSSGLPKGGSKGFELFDSASLTTSAMMEKINGMRAKQGELERTIQSIEAVKNARVHITEPDRSSFVKKDILPTASVLLRLKPGMEITPSQVKAITHLVAGSIERLTPENVTVMDSKGNLLSDKRGEGELGEDQNERLDYQRKLEASYVKRIETMISEILGTGKVVARVTADIDFSKFEKEEELYDPSGSVARSEKVVEDGASGKSADGGVAGVSSNLTNDPNLLKAKESTAGNAAHRETVKNYEISRAVSKTSSAAGKIQRLTVAVLVDGQYIIPPVAEKDKTAEEPAKLYRPLSSEMIRKIENLVKQSVGFDSTRGDIVTVENIQFLNDNSIEKQLEASAPTVVDKYVFPFVLPAIFVLMFFFVGLKPLIRFITTPSASQSDLSKLLPEGINELEAEIDVENGKAGVVPEVKLDINMEELEGLIAANSSIVKQNPQQAALLIRYWLNEGRL